MATDQEEHQVGAPAGFLPEHVDLFAEVRIGDMDVLGADFGGYLDGGEGEKGICYNDLVAVLWKAVQELKAELDVLKAAAL